MTFGKKWSVIFSLAAVFSAASCSFPYAEEGLDREAEEAVSKNYGKIENCYWYTDSVVRYIDNMEDRRVAFKYIDENAAIEEAQKNIARYIEATPLQGGVRLAVETEGSIFVGRAMSDVQMDVAKFDLLDAQGRVLVKNIGEKAVWHRLRNLYGF